MKEAIKRMANRSINCLTRIAERTVSGRYFLERILNRTIESTRSVLHGGVSLTFAVPNSLNHFRVDTFSTKEPETLEWIDSFSNNAIVWDIGANVGLYSCYAAKTKNCNVFAFEPSVFNLELLARNIYLNGIASQTTIISLPLSDKLSRNSFHMSSTEWGGALSTFAQNYGQDGEPLSKVFEYQTVGISMDEAIENLRIPQPDYIKMDVDGIEHLILKGGASVLKKVKGILIEINEEFQKQSIDSERYLTEAGLVLKEKRHSEMFDDSVFKNSYNQIWHRLPN